MVGKSEGQAVLGRQSLVSTPWLTERHGYDPTSPAFLISTANDRASLVPANIKIISVPLPSAFPVSGDVGGHGHGRGDRDDGDVRPHDDGHDHGGGDGRVPSYADDTGMYHSSSLPHYAVLLPPALLKSFAALDDNQNSLLI